MSFGSGAGDVYKIRIGHNEAYPGSGWYLEKVRNAAMWSLFCLYLSTFQLYHWLILPTLCFINISRVADQFNPLCASLTAEASGLLQWGRVWHRGQQVAVPFPWRRRCMEGVRDFSDRESLTRLSHITSFHFFLDKWLRLVLCHDN